MGAMLPALRRHGVPRFPEQHLGMDELKRFSEQFSEIRLIRHCQVVATEVFDPDFLRPAPALAAVDAA
jgi:hypothetical protein